MNDLLTYLLGGGFVSALLGLFTVRSKIRKIRAETESLHLDNTEKATEILMHNIVEPLKQELYATRKEMALLRAAIRDARHCRYADDCPVLQRLHERKENRTEDGLPRRVHDGVPPLAATGGSADNTASGTAEGAARRA